MDWNVNRLKSQLREFPWFRTANADEYGPTYDGFALFNYTPWHIAKRDDELRYVSSLVLDFKKDERAEPKTVRAAREAIRLIAIEALHDLIWHHKWKGQALPRDEKDRWWQTPDGASDSSGNGWHEGIPPGQGWHDRMLMAVPGHLRGIGKPATKAFADAICSMPWYPAVELGDPPHFAQQSLQRHTEQERSTVQRQSMAQHLETMRLIDDPKPDSAHHHDGALKFMLVDDVYTTGATYGACKHLVRERYPAADIMGMFVAITAY
jgi:hypothetical protein